MEIERLPDSTRIDSLEEEIMRALILTEQTSKVVVKQTETIEAVGDTLKGIGKVLKELLEEIKSMDHRIKWLEAGSPREGGPLQ